MICPYCKSKAYYLHDVDLMNERKSMSVYKCLDCSILNKLSVTYVFSDNYIFEINFFITNSGISGQIFNDLNYAVLQWAEKAPLTLFNYKYNPKTYKDMRFDYIPDWTPSNFAEKAKLYMTFS